MKPPKAKPSKQNTTNKHGFNSRNKGVSNGPGGATGKGIKARKIRKRSKSPEKKSK